MSDLNPDKALIFRITHRENVPWILQNGLHCRNAGCSDPNYHEIGNPELISKRAHRPVPIAPGGTLSDYIPFYFTPFTPMLLNIKTGYAGMKQTAMADVAILVSSLPKVIEMGGQFVFSDRHAYLQTALFSSSLVDLGTYIDWESIQARDFKRDPENPEKFERYQAEALIHDHLPVEGIVGIVLQNDTARETLSGAVPATLASSLRIITRQTWFFS